MKWFSAGLTLVNVTTIAGLLLGMLAGGLDQGFAGLALLAGCGAAIVAWLQTSPFLVRQKVRPAAPNGSKSKRGRRKRKPAQLSEQSDQGPWRFWSWVVGIIFGLFALRSFCWLLYIDGPVLRIQSPNNLGDLALHLSYIKYFANGVALWPDNPIFVFSDLRYPAGIDLFNGLLLLAHIDLIRGLVWVGLLASLATFYALYRWGGAFTVAGFLFNGGITGLAYFYTWKMAEQQVPEIAWKSIPLTMFVTQRGLLYALPAGLALLLHWRKKFIPNNGETPAERLRAGYFPWWIEWSLYATMPLFHVHTFLALSAVLACWLVLGPNEMRLQIVLLIAAAFVPATGIVWLITDHFQAKSILAWQPGWLEADPGFSNSALFFWFRNFGLTIPFVAALLGLVAWRQYRVGKFQFTSSIAFLVPAFAIFVFAFFVKTAPWGWDNTKLFIWAYFIALPFLWSDFLARLVWPLRYVSCALLFASGFATLIDGLRKGSPGYEIANRAELAAVADVVRPLPIADRFATFPTYNHPLLLNGRKVVLGYPGHLWTQGFDYAPVERQLNALMLGASDWRQRADALHVRYLFWGNEEKRAYPTSRQPWRGKAAVVADNSWFTLYDLKTPFAPSE